MRLRYLPLALAAALPTTAAAQDSAASASCVPQGTFNLVPSFAPVEVNPDGTVTFRLCAPAATDVRVISNDVGQANHTTLPQLTGKVSINALICRARLNSVFWVRWV